MTLSVFAHCFTDRNQAHRLFTHALVETLFCHHHTLFKQYPHFPPSCFAPIFLFFSLQILKVYTIFFNHFSPTSSSLLMSALYSLAASPGSSLVSLAVSPPYPPCYSHSQLSIIHSTFFDNSSLFTFCTLAAPSPPLPQHIMYPCG